MEQEIQNRWAPTQGNRVNLVILEILISWKSEDEER